MKIRMTEKGQLVLSSALCIASLIIFKHLDAAIFVALMMIVGINICIRGERHA